MDFQLRFIRGLADALDRIGATLVALCLVGGWFTEQITAGMALLGTLVGLAMLTLGVYAKVRLDLGDVS